MSLPPQSSATSSDGLSKPANSIAISRRTLILGAAVLLVLVLAAALCVGFVVGAQNSSRSGEPATANAPVVTTPESSSRSAAPQTPAPEPTAETFRLGDTFKTGDVTLTVNSIEAVDSIATTDGTPIMPDAGGQLFVLKMTYSNSMLQADLSCGFTDLYLQAFDTLEREMAAVFELYRIPGNPECNDHLLQNTPHEWTYIFQSVAGASPLALSVIEGENYLNPIWVDLQ